MSDSTIHRNVQCPILFSWVLSLIFYTVLGSYQSAAAATTQVALFRGFSIFPVTDTGMDELHADLLANPTIPNYDGMVFHWNQKQEAFDWIQQASDRLTLVLIGHSFGANDTLQLANNFLKPEGVDVDLTIQVDSVANGDGGWNDQLPTNVEMGFNYFQMSEGGFGDFQGEMNVQGATNINAEIEFNDTTITHTSLDNDDRLHEAIVQHILDNLNQEDADFDGSGIVDGEDFLLWQRGGSPSPFSTAELNLWETQYGTTLPLGSASTAIPEPATFVMLMLGLGGVFSGRRLRVS